MGGKWAEMKWDLIPGNDSKDNIIPELKRVLTVQKNPLFTIRREIWCAESAEKLGVQTRSPPKLFISTVEWLVEQRLNPTNRSSRNNNTHQTLSSDRRR